MEAHQRTSTISWVAQYWIPEKARILPFSGTLNSPNILASPSTSCSVPFWLLNAATNRSAFLMKSFSAHSEDSGFVIENTTLSATLLLASDYVFEWELDSVTSEQPIVPLQKCSSYAPVLKLSDRSLVS